MKHLGDKLLVIRLSSIGDIILSTVVVRCLKKQIKNCTLHFLVKRQFYDTVKDNPYIDVIHIFDGKLSVSVAALKQERFDYLIDLHNNQRSFLIKKRLGVKAFSLDKINVRKWLMVNTKINYLPKRSIVDRYMATVQSFGVLNDGQGLDFFIEKKQEVNIFSRLSINPNAYIAFAIGGSYATKRLPLHKLITICELIQHPLVLLGGKTDSSTGSDIAAKCGSSVINCCGILSLQQSASVVRQALGVIAHDTGMMHIAAAFNRPICSVWGNTIPEFGMYPYFATATEAGIQAAQKSLRVFVDGLSCRPCSKLGYNKCPKKHFNCMELISETLIEDWANGL